MDNTLVMVFSDNGASAEGGQQGSVNEHRFTAHVRESVADNLAHYDDWGGFTTYNHYSWGWAWAGNTPHRLWKRYTWLGGTRTPLIVHWPGHVARPGVVRSPVRPRHRPHADHPRRPPASRCPARSTASPSSPSTGSASSRRSTTRRGRSARTRSTSRCSARARSTTTAGRRRPITSAPASSTRRSWPSAAELRRGPLGAVRPRRPTSPRRSTAPARPDAVAAPRSSCGGRGGRNDVLPDLRRPGRPLRRLHPADLARRDRRGRSGPAAARSPTSPSRCCGVASA